MAACATITDITSLNIQLRRTHSISTHYAANAGWLVFTALVVFIVEGLVIAQRFLNIAAINSYILIVFIAVRLPCNHNVLYRNVLYCIVYV